MVTCLKFVRLAIAASAFTLALVGCASDPRVATRSVDLIAPAGANLDNPVPVDLVLVLEKDALAQVSTLTAAQWRRQREQLTLAFPTGIRVAAFELAPGQNPLTYQLEGEDRKAIGAFIFADYVTEGAHRAKVDRIEAVRVQLGQRSFSLAGGD